MGALSKEAAYIAQAFSQQVLNKGTEYTFEKPHPFQKEGENAAAVGYRYNRWNLDENLVLVGRCEVDAVMTGKDKKNIFMTIKTLNEYEPRSDWRKKIDNQRAAILATEFRPNANKMSKWACQALLAGTDTVRLGFVARSGKDTHAIVAVQDYSTREYAAHITLNVKNAWAALKHILGVCMKQPAGKYVLMRHPDKPFLQLFAIPETEDATGKAEAK
jgi:translation initiation factor 3 subunit D